MQINLNEEFLRYDTGPYDSGDFNVLSSRAAFARGRNSFESLDFSISAGDEEDVLLSRGIKVTQSDKSVLLMHYTLNMTTTSNSNITSHRINVAFKSS